MILGSFNQTDGPSSVSNRVASFEQVSRCRHCTVVFCFPRLHQLNVESTSTYLHRHEDDNSNFLRKMSVKLCVYLDVFRRTEDGLTTFIRDASVNLWNYTLSTTRILLHKIFVSVVHSARCCLIFRRWRKIKSKELRVQCTRTKKMYRNYILNLKYWDTVMSKPARHLIDVSSCQRILLPLTE